MHLYAHTLTRIHTHTHTHSLTPLAHTHTQVLNWEELEEVSVVLRKIEVCEEAQPGVSKMIYLVNEMTVVVSVSIFSHSSRGKMLLN